jgi:hypothetical protein
VEIWIRHANGWRTERLLKALSKPKGGRNSPFTAFFRRFQDDVHGAAQRRSAVNIAFARR